MHICVVSAELSLFFTQIKLDENLYFHVGNFLCAKGNNFKRMQSRVVVPVLCTSSHGALHLCEVS